MVPYYQHYIAEWRALTASLSPELYRVLHILVEEAMIEEGPVTRHDRSLAGKANMSPKKLGRVLEDLTDLELITSCNGKLSCLYAERRMETIEEYRANARKAGMASGLSRRKRRESDENASEIRLSNEETLPRREDERKGDRESPDGEPRGTRLPDNWNPNAEDIALARAEGLTQKEIERSVAQFCDHYRSSSGWSAMKNDWAAAFRKWVRTDADRAKKNAPKRKAI